MRAAKDNARHDPSGSEILPPLRGEESCGLGKTGRGTPTKSAGLHRASHQPSVVERVRPMELRPRRGPEAGSREGFPPGRGKGGTYGEMCIKKKKPTTAALKKSCHIDKPAVTCNTCY